MQKGWSMRCLLLTLVLAAGCITTGSKSGISPEAEQQLETLGPKFNAQFQLDGSSLSLERYRQLDVRARSNAFVPAATSPVYRFSKTELARFYP